MILPWRDVEVSGQYVRTSLTEAESNRLLELAGVLGRHSLVLEIGSGFGYSSILCAHAGSHVFAVDPHGGASRDGFIPFVDSNSAAARSPALPGSLDRMRWNLEACGVADKVTMILAASQVVLPVLHRLGITGFDLVFVDGDHAFEAVDGDLYWAHKLVASRGAIAVHDFGEDSCPGVAEAVVASFGSPPELVDTLAVFPGWM